MLIFGHVGLTLAAARRLKSSLSFPAIAAVSLAQDLIDKPLRYFFLSDFCRGNTRTVAHSVTGSFILACLIYAVLRWRRIQGALWVFPLIFLHLIFDMMWHPLMRVSLFWPWMGNEFPLLQESGWSGLREHIKRDVFSFWNIIGESLGLWILIGELKRRRIDIRNSR